MATRHRVHGRRCCLRQASSSPCIRARYGPQSQPGHRIAPVNTLADALVCHGWRFSSVTGNVRANAATDTAVNHLAARSGRCAVLIADFILDNRFGVRRRTAGGNEQSAGSALPCGGSCVVCSCRLHARRERCCGRPFRDPGKARRELAWTQGSEGPAGRTHRLSQGRLSLLSEQQLAVGRPRCWRRLTSCPSRR